MRLKCISITQWLLVSASALSQSRVVRKLVRVHVGQTLLEDTKLVIGYVVSEAAICNYVITHQQNFVPKYDQRVVLLVEEGGYLYKKYRLSGTNISYIAPQGVVDSRADALRRNQSVIDMHLTHIIQTFV